MRVSAAFLALLLGAIPLSTSSLLGRDLSSLDTFDRLHDGPGAPRGREKVTENWLAENYDLMEQFFSGEYTFSGGTEEFSPNNGKAFEPATELDVLYFPSNNRNRTDTGYQNARRPPEPWYAKIPKGTTAAIRFEAGRLVVSHKALDGAYTPEQVGETIESFVQLSSTSKYEKVRFNPSTQEMIFSLRQGVPIVGGCRIEIRVRKTSNGDLDVTDHYKGWALLPSPQPIIVVKTLTLIKVR